MTCSFGVWWHFPLAFMLTIVAVIAHEAVHYIGMWPVAERVEIHVSDWSLSDVYVESEIRDEHWRHRWADIVGIGPLLIALLVAAWWGVTGWPGTDMLGLAKWNAWLWFGFLGGLSDYSREASEGSAGDREAAKPEPLIALPDGGEAVLERNRRLVDLTMLGIAAAALGMFYMSFCTGGVAQRAWTLATLGLLLTTAAITGVLAREGDPGDDLT
jgi:hypothetical protein